MANKVHPTAIVHQDVILGDNNVIGPYCIIYPNVEIGSGNIFMSHVTIGSPAEDKRSTQLSNGVVIGSNNQFREFITINSGTNSMTRIHDNGFFMRGCHFGHDSDVRSNVTMACNSIIGGHTLVMDYANIGLGAIIHQNVIIAPVSMLGMGCIVTKKTIVEMGYIYAGNPAQKLKENTIGYERNNIDLMSRKKLEADWLSEMVKRRMG
jgi:UDP-N-acetylglucosamine acyltransferase